MFTEGRPEEGATDPLEPFNQLFSPQRRVHPRLTQEAELELEEAGAMCGGSVLFWHNETADQLVNSWSLTPLFSSFTQLLKVNFAGKHDNLRTSPQNSGEFSPDWLLLEVRQFLYSPPGAQWDCFQEGLGVVGREEHHEAEVPAARISAERGGARRPQEPRKLSFPVCLSVQTLFRTASVLIP